MNQKSVARNSFFFFIAQATTALLAFVSSVIIARAFGPYITGQYNYLVWIGSLFIAVSTLGIPNALTKFIAEYSDAKNPKISQKISGDLLAASVILGLLAAILLCLLAVFKILPTNIKTYYFYIVAAALPLNIIAATFVGIFKGNRRYAALMRGSIIASPLTFAVILIILSKKATLTGLATYYILTGVILVLSYLIVARGTIKTAIGALPSTIYRPIVKYIFVVSGVLLLDQVVWDKSEVLFLGHYSQPQQVAFYSLSYTLTSSVMTLLPGSILGALLPHIASLNGVKNAKAIASSYQAAIKYVSIIVGALIAGGIALATPLIHTLYGNQYVQMIEVFRVLVFSAGWAAIVGVASTILYGMTRQTFLLKVGILLSVVNITLDFLIIPGHGAMGAAIVNGTTQFLGGIWTIYLLTKHVGLPFPTVQFVKVLGISLLSCLSILLLVNESGGQGLLSLTVFGLAFILLYTLLLFISKALTIAEIPFLNSRGAS